MEICLAGSPSWEEKLSCPEKSKEYANKAIALTVEETARAYYQHFLAKLASYWDRVRDKVGRQSPPALSRLQQAQDELAADTGPTLAGGDLPEQGGEGNMPDELPCLMTTRQRLPPKDSWSDFVFDVLFHHPKWSQLYFLQLYRSFREHFGIRIGHYIRVIFNTDRSKEAPYFSPPQRQKDIPLSSMYHRYKYPNGLSPSTPSAIPTARDFQTISKLAWKHWVKIVDNIDSLRSASHSYIRRHCRPALMYVTVLSGPTWGPHGDVNFIQPWSVGRQDAHEYGEEDGFRIPTTMINDCREHCDAMHIFCRPFNIRPQSEGTCSLHGHDQRFLVPLKWDTARISGHLALRVFVTSSRRTRHHLITSFPNKEAQFKIVPTHDNQEANSSSI
ncbi:hypothetical protein DER46DRAFT_621133 [Fusarium sp. MPI-SDFR-AT-0072]|nr:hypothetical protein DER46DRAFT_621133 [Fusarium sp. MPI-SDFR-AT-0072]